jgi:hypothetical protein
MLLGARATFVDFSRFWGWHPFQLLFSDDAGLKLWDRLRRLLARNKPENTGPASSIGRGPHFTSFFLTIWFWREFPSFSSYPLFPDIQDTRGQTLFGQLRHSSQVRFSI